MIYSTEALLESTTVYLCLSRERHAPLDMKTHARNYVWASVCVCVWACRSIDMADICLRQLRIMNAPELCIRNQCSIPEVTDKEAFIFFFYFVQDGDIFE